MIHSGGIHSRGAMTIPDRRGNWIRARTLISVRWIAIAGQATALLLAILWFGIDLPAGACLALIALSAGINLTLGAMLPASRRLTPPQVLAMLLFDIGQLMALVALTGGLSNPFTFLVLAPVTVSASALPLRSTLVVAGAAIVLTTAVTVAYVPIYRPDGIEIHQPPLLVIGSWVGIVTGIMFVALYARRVAFEIHLMSEALLAAQLALAREQKLTDLGGIVAATAHELGTPLATIKIASAEMVAELADRPDLAEDARLIRAQAERCHTILQAMGKRGKEDDYFAHARFLAVVREAAEPHTDRGKEIEFVVRNAPASAAGMIVHRRPELIHGIRNLIQNAVDFAAAKVRVEIEWSGRDLTLRIADDGPGYPPHLIERLGDPFLPRRERTDAARPGYEGMGMGLFIAKTLLERTGAEIAFMNDAGGGGALVSVHWAEKTGLTVGDAEAAESGDSPDGGTRGHGGRSTDSARP